VLVFGCVFRRHVMIAITRSINSIFGARSKAHGTTEAHGEVEEVRGTVLDPEASGAVERAFGSGGGGAAEKG